jgi:hypothetical protein
LRTGAVEASKVRAGGLAWSVLQDLLFRIRSHLHRRSFNVNGTLMVHTGGRHRPRDELAALPTPEATDTWKPVPHQELVESLTSVEGQCPDL